MKHYTDKEELIGRKTINPQSEWKLQRVFLASTDFLTLFFLSRRCCMSTSPSCILAAQPTTQTTNTTCKLNCTQQSTRNTYANRLLPGPWTYCWEALWASLEWRSCPSHLLANETFCVSFFLLVLKKKEKNKMIFTYYAPYDNITTDAC